MTTGSAPTEPILVLRNLLANYLGVTRASTMQRIAVLPEEVLLELTEIVRTNEESVERQEKLTACLLEAELKLAQQRVDLVRGKIVAVGSGEHAELIAERPEASPLAAPPDRQAATQSSDHRPQAAADPAPEPPGVAAENAATSEPLAGSEAINTGPEPPYQFPGPQGKPIGNPPQASPAAQPTSDESGE